MTLPVRSGGALTVERGDEDDGNRYLRVFLLSVVSPLGLNGCGRQDPPPKAVKELPSFLIHRLVGWPGARSTRPRELRQRWERQAIG